MKKFNFWTCASLVCISTMVMAQNDQNWLIINRQGRSGASQYTNSISSNNFYINGIPYPDLEEYPDATNELFVIYTNGNYFSSRNGDNLFNPAMPNEVNHFMSGTYLNSTIHHAYLTRTYQGNDPPPGYTVTGNAGGTSFDGPFLFDVTTPTQVLTANHDVVRNSDITLIISNQLLLDTLGGSKPAFLRFQSIVPIGSETPYTSPNFFRTRSIGPLGNSAFYPIGNALPTTQPVKVELQNIFNSIYTYVNLRPYQIPDVYFLQNPQNPQLATHQALFEIVDENDKVVASLREDLRNSHDPNFMKVLGVREDDTDCVCYQVHFENDGTEPVDKLRVEIEFGDDFQTYCIGNVSWRVGSDTRDGRLTVRRSMRYFNYDVTHPGLASGSMPLYEYSRKVTFKFNADAYLQPIPRGRNQSAVEKGSADLHFCMRLNSAIDWSDHENSLKPLALRVYFDRDEYQIMEFFDIYKYKNEKHLSATRHDGGITCHGECPRSIQSRLERIQMRRGVIR